MDNSLKQAFKKERLPLKDPYPLLSCFLGVPILFKAVLMLFKAVLRLLKRPLFKETYREI